jgi:hypothetical protein
MQAYRQRAVTGDLSETDESGNPVDYNQVLKNTPAAVWLLPENVNMWESASTDLSPLLNAETSDIRTLAAVTRTPLSMLIPESVNQSAEGAANSKEGLILKAMDRQTRVDREWARLISLIFLWKGKKISPSEIHITWQPVDLLTLSERADANTKTVDIPWRTRMEKIMRFSPEEIDRMEVERNQELLLASLAQPSPLTGRPGAQNQRSRPGTTPQSGSPATSSRNADSQNNPAQGQ